MNNIGNMVQQLERGALEPDQRQEWERIIHGVTPDRFAQVVTDAMRQTEPGQYETHLNAADKGINSIANLSRDQQVGLAQTAIGELAKIGVNSEAATQASGIANLNARELPVGDLVKLLGWIQTNHPQVLGNIAGRYLDQPNILAHLLGAQTLMAVVSNLGVQTTAGQAGG